MNCVMNILIAYVTILEIYCFIIDESNGMKNTITTLRKIVAALLIRLLLKVMPPGENKKSLATWILKTYVPSKQQHH